MDSHVFIIALEVSGLWFFSYIYQKQPNEMKWLEEDIECEINEQSLSAGLNAVTVKRAFCGLAIIPEQMFSIQAQWAVPHVRCVTKQLHNTYLHFLLYRNKNITEVLQSKNQLALHSQSNMKFCIRN